MCEDCCPTCGQPYNDPDDFVDDRTPEQIAADEERWAAEKMLRDSPLGLAAHPDNIGVLADWAKARSGEMTFKAFTDKWLPYLEWRKK